MADRDVMSIRIAQLHPFVCCLFDGVCKGCGLLGNHSRERVAAWSCHTTVSSDCEGELLCLVLAYLALRGSSSFYYM